MATAKYAPTDWHTSNTVIRSSAEKQRLTSHTIRNQSNITRNETDHATRWTQYRSDCNITHRVTNITNWKDTLAKTLSDTETEIDKLLNCKRQVEFFLEAKDQPLEVAYNCLQLREHRIEIDSVRDEVECELNKEVEVISGIRSLLNHRISEAFSQLSVLQSCHKQLSDDLTDKHSAIFIDSDCVRLTNQSTNVSMQTDPTRIVKGIVTPEQWESHSNHNVLRAEKEVGLSNRLRDTMNQTMQQTNSDLESQWIATNTALRKRIHELTQTKLDLDWQRKNTIEEIAKVTYEINSLEQAIKNKTPPLMVAQTRLENRTYRPNVELCRDSPQYQLAEEVGEIISSQRSLQKELELATLSLGTLQRTLKRIENDLSIKTNSLNLDQQCLIEREKLSQHPNPKKVQQLLQNDEKI